MRIVFLLAIFVFLLSFFCDVCLIILLCICKVWIISDSFCIPHEIKYVCEIFNPNKLLFDFSIFLCLLWIASSRTTQQRIRKFQDLFFFNSAFTFLVLSRLKKFSFCSYSVLLEKDDINNSWNEYQTNWFDYMFIILASHFHYNWNHVWVLLIVASIYNQCNYYWYCFLKLVLSKTRAICIQLCNFRQKHVQRRIEM